MNALDKMLRNNSLDGLGQKVSVREEWEIGKGPGCGIGRSFPEERDMQCDKADVRGHVR